MTEERPVFIPQTPKVFTSSYGSGMQEARIAVPMQPLIPVVQPVACMYSCPFLRVDF